MTSEDAPVTSAVRLPRLLRAGRPRLLAALVAVGFGKAAVALGSAYLVGTAFATLLGTTVSGKVVAALGLGLMSLAAFGAVLTAVERVFAEELGQSYVHAVRMKLFGQITRTPVREATRYSTGAASLRFTGDLSAVRLWVSLGISRLTVATPLIAICLMALVVVSPLIAIGVVVVLIAGLLVTLWQNRRLREASITARRRRSRLAAHVTEHVAHSVVMQAFGQEKAELRAVRRRGTHLRQAMVERAKAIGQVRATAEATVGLAVGGVVVLAVASGQGAGPAAAAVALVGYLVGPVRELSRVGEYRTSAAVALGKIAEVLGRPRRTEPPEGAPELGRGPGLLELDAVTSDGLFGPLTARAVPGQVVALIGPNGAGKSTLLSIVAGLTDPDAGAVRLDGTNVVEASTRSVRRAIGLVSADVPLLRGTVTDNVRYADPDASDEAVARVISRCGLDEVMSQLPEGRETRVGERGARLSSGQRQRVALARAVLTTPRLLLLDEADANLDPTAAAVIDLVVDDYPGTVVMVTHRPERAGRADVVWELADGQLRVRTQAPCPAA